MLRFNRLVYDSMIRCISWWVLQGMLWWTSKLRSPYTGLNIAFHESFIILSTSGQLSLDVPWLRTVGVRGMARINYYILLFCIVLYVSQEIMIEHGRTSPVSAPSSVTRDTSVKSKYLTKGEILQKKIFLLTRGRVSFVGARRHSCGDLWSTPPKLGTFW